MQFLSPQKLSPNMSRPIIQQPPIQRPPIIGTAVNRSGMLSPPATSAGKIPTNVNYSVNQGRYPPTIGPGNNNKLDINLNINANQDGSVTASTGQGMAMPMPMQNNFRPQMPQMIGQRQPMMPPKPMPQVMSLGYSMGPPALPYGFNPMGSSMVRGAPYGMHYMPPRYPQPTYVGYKTLNQPGSSSISNDGSVHRSLPKIDTNVEDQKVYCVLCQTQYATKNKQEHIKRHQRPPQNTERIKKLTKEYHEQYTGPKSRPIVEPEQYNIQYNPNSFILEQETKFSTPAIPPPPPSVIPARNTLGIGTSDPAGQNYINTNNQSTIINPQRNTTFQPENVRLTHDGQQVTYVDPNQYQGGRIMRESQQNNQPSLIQNNPPTMNPDSRFSRNTFISDQPSPIVQPPSILYGRQTIQSQQFRGSQLPQSMRVGATNTNTNTGTVQPAPLYQSSTPTPQPIPQTNTLPSRDTVMSQDFRNSQIPPPNTTTLTTTPTNTQNPYLSVSQKIAANHQSVMSPIHQQSQNRQTTSQQLNTQQPHLSNYHQTQPLPSQINRPVTIQPSTSTYNNNTNQPRSTLIDPLKSIDQYKKDNLPVIGSQSGRITNNDTSLLDEFAYGNASPDTKIIPREARSTINQDIPISAIIQDKFGK